MNIAFDNNEQLQKSAESLIKHWLKMFAL
jgi:hypothetical protein